MKVPLRTANWMRCTMTMRNDAFRCADELFTENEIEVFARLHPNGDILSFIGLVYLQSIPSLHRWHHRNN